MGLLERMERRQSEIDVPKDISLEYESMDDDIRKEIINFWKRLFIRGTLGAKEEYCEKSNICVRDREKEVICFKQGKNANEHYFGLIIKNEMWTVSGIVDRRDVTGNSYSDIEVLYVPSKIGKVSNVDDKVLNIAKDAVAMLSNDKINEYVDSLKIVLSEDCVKEYIEMQDSWYEQLFADENCRQLRDYQMSKLQAKKEQERIVEFDYELVKELEFDAVVNIVSEKMAGNKYILNPKICVKMKDENIRCFKYLKDAEGNECDNIQYYVMLINSEVVLLGALEERESGNISIEKMSIFSDGDYNFEALQKTAVGAVLKIQEVWYNKPSVKCSESIHIERCAYYKQIEI